MRPERIIIHYYDNVYTCTQNICRVNSNHWRWVPTKHTRIDLCDVCVCVCVAFASFLIHFPFVLYWPRCVWLWRVYQHESVSAWLKTLFLFYSTRFAYVFGVLRLAIIMYNIRVPHMFAVSFVFAAAQPFGVVGEKTLLVRFPKLISSADCFFFHFNYRVLPF